MLLYVNKKKQKRRRVKIITVVFVCCFIFCANIIVFLSSLHETDKHLAEDYSLFGKKVDASEPGVVCLFSAKSKALPEIVILPDVMNRQNLITTAYAFSKLAAAGSVYFSPEVENSEYLLKLLQLYLPDVRLSDAKGGIIITSDEKNFSDIIKGNKLYPKVYYYNHAVRQQKPDGLDMLLDEQFPLPLLPKSRLEKEKAALKLFAETFQEELRGMLNGRHNADFAFRHYLLQQANLCFVSERQAVCRTDAKVSLQKSLLSFGKKAKKIVLLTSLQEIKFGENTEADEGIVFRYGEREAIILPFEKNKYSDLYSALKQNAGVNPEYHAVDMKYYKFKTAEVYADDKI